MAQEKRSEETVVVVESIAAITCDLCGRREADQEMLGNFGVNNTYASLDWTAGYGTDLDGTTFHVDFCDTCMALLASSDSRKERLNQLVAALKDF